MNKRDFFDKWFPRIDENLRAEFVDDCKAMAEEHALGMIDKLCAEFEAESRMKVQ